MFKNLQKQYRLWKEDYWDPYIFFRPIRFFWQRRTRGFDETELWNLDSTILKFILPRLQAFRESSRFGWPGPEMIFKINFKDFEVLSESEKIDLNQRSIEEWDRMLDKMIRAVELWIKYDGIFIGVTSGRREESVELRAEYEEGWKLFVKWFHALWD